MAVDLGRIPKSIWWGQDPVNSRPGVFLLDQTRLPLVGDILCCQKLSGVETAIQSLAVRGAPALAIAAAMAIAVWSENESNDSTVDGWLAGIDRAAERIGNARPTAVNLRWGAEGLRTHAHALAAEGLALVELKAAVVEFALELARQDEANNRAIGANGADLLQPGSRVLTHCNAGSLATGFYGTALGVVYSSYDQGKVSQVWVDETRPLNQGGRLTAWELMAAGVPATLIADSMAAFVMQSGWVDVVLVGADRICRNGDTANKVGTLSLAIAARHFDIPFYVAAPLATIDRSLADGSGIPIELRDRRELAGMTVSGTLLAGDTAQARALEMLTARGQADLAAQNGHQISLGRTDSGYRFDAWLANTPPDVPVYNPAFDITPSELISAFVTEAGVFTPDRLMEAFRDD